MKFCFNFSKIMGRMLSFRTQQYFSHYAKIPTVYALSTGVNSAISIVRISGEQSYKVLYLLKYNSQISISKQTILEQFKIKPRQMSLRSIYNSKVYFEASKSYSGEDLFELHLHGSKAIVLALFQELNKLNFKPAKRGQFTKRGFLNGRMSLIQAESINDLIRSQTEFQRQIAINNMIGKSKKCLQRLRKSLIQIKVIVQSFIQFEELEVGLGLLDKAKKYAETQALGIQTLIESSKKLQKVKQGIKISIVGKPNVGKSTLINSLVQKNISIVSDIPGTTRDLIQSSVEINGYRMNIVDTAGIRQSNCQIQQEGVKRSKMTIENSQIVLILFDISQVNLLQTQQVIIIIPDQTEKILLKNQNRYVVVNKIDKLTSLQKDKKIIIQYEDVQIIPHVCISAKESIIKLIQDIGNLLQNRYNLYRHNTADIFFTRQRQIQALQGCKKYLQKFINAQYADIGSYYLDQALLQVQEIIGKIDNEQILDEIFSTFCIGK